uniref:4-hydroxy-7-methoxy-3-oxo-3,4-dihydro-2H-1,4-benzoxazin-2-yl glucosidebeta-D-glucosidase n=1 Tax=Oryza nivara TaxID=4536 RepID=A0A0E0HDE8_ORYNI
MEIVKVYYVCKGSTSGWRRAGSRSKRHPSIPCAGGSNGTPHAPIDRTHPSIPCTGSGTLDGTLDDVERIDCLAKYIAATLKAIRNGANVKGYSVWSFMDLYELFGGYNTWHYGLIAVDFSSAERRRQPRRSASWYSDFLKNNAVIRVEDGSSLLMLNSECCLSQVPNHMNGVNLNEYSMWSFMDPYELFGAYNTGHYGLVAVDFNSAERRRQPRRSASWYSNFLKNNAVIWVEDGSFVSATSHALNFECCHSQTILLSQ